MHHLSFLVPFLIQKDLRNQAALRIMNEKHAAFQTWSGKQAAAHGFKNVVIAPLLNGIQATFTK